MEEQAPQRRRIVFSGRVQGVGFRATARAIAGSHLVTGWVRNEPDGSVLVEVQGAQAGIEAFLAELRRTMGRLIRSETSSVIVPETGDKGFEVRR